MQRSIESKKFFVRIRSMLKLDFYRLFHTPVFYIMIAVAALIPALLMTMTLPSTDPQTGEVVPPSMTIHSMADLVASDEPMYMPVNEETGEMDMGAYANMNMVFIFSGIMMSIFIAHDYMSGFVKNIFTVHAKKQDYVISKVVVGVFGSACMMITYLIGAVVAGLIVGVPLLAGTQTIGGLLLCLLGKLCVSIGFSTLFVLVNVFFRRLLGMSITGCFFFGTGIVVMAAAGMAAMAGAPLNGNINILSGFLYGSAVTACLNSTAINVLICLGVSLVWTVVYTLISTQVLKKRDLV